MRKSVDRLAECYAAVDALWRIELLGDAPLTMLWKKARRILAEAVKQERDSERYLAYMASHGIACIKKRQKPPTARGLRADGSARRTAA